MLVWIHGGSFTYGDGASYDAHRLATQGNLVVVTLNYRLGAFGFMAHPAVAGSGNYGLEDQQAALRWVRQNASAFGGDPGNVTVMGQSGGGYSVCAHLTMPSSAGLFDRAIIQSAGCSNPNSVMSREAAQKSGIDFANQLGCTDPATTLACMREADEDKVLAAAEVGHDGYRPIVGGLLPRRPADAIAQGRFHKVPLLFGVNHDEESGRVAGPELYTGVPLDEAGYVQMVRDEFKTNADAVLAEYPVADYATPSEAATAAITDGNWSTYVRQTQLLLAKHVRVFAYDFTEKQSPWFAGFNQPKWTMGTGHMVEMAYLFDLKLFAPLTDHQRQLSTDVIGYWASFAHDGDPNHKGAPKWRPFNKNEYTQAIATGPEGMCSTDFAADHRYRFWSSLNR